MAERIILLRMTSNDVKMDSENKRAGTGREDIIVMFRHARMDRADLHIKGTSARLMRPCLKEGRVSEGGSDFSFKSRLNPGLSGNVAECKIGGSVSDELPPHGWQG